MLIIILLISAIGIFTGIRIYISKQKFKELKKEQELLNKQIDYLWERINELEKDMRELLRTK